MEKDGIVMYAIVHAYTSLLWKSKLFDLLEEKMLLNPIISFFPPQASNLFTIVFSSFFPFHAMADLLANLCYSYIFLLGINIAYHWDINLGRTIEGTIIYCQEFGYSLVEWSILQRLICLNCRFIFAALSSLGIKEIKV